MPRSRRSGISASSCASGWPTTSPTIRSGDPVTCSPPSTSVALLNAHNIQKVGREMAAIAPVWLDGEGPDNALTLERNAYLGWLRRNRSWRRLAQALVQYTAAKGLARLGADHRRAHRAAKREAELEPVDILPAWLQRDFAGSAETAGAAGSPRPGR